MKANVRVIIVLLSVLVLMAAVLWRIGLLGSHRFTPHVVVWVGSDKFPNAGQETPTYALYLKGGKRNEVQFSGDQLIHRYADECGCYQVCGVGDLLWGAVRIRVEGQLVKVNGQDLPRKALHDFIVDRDGRVEDGHIMTVE